MKKILVIDDEIDAVEMLKKRLEYNQYQVIGACDGVEGIKMAKRELPDLILLDICMPVMDGYSFVQEYQKIEEIKHIPLLICTAKAELKDIFKLEGFPYLLKPLRVEELIGKINELLAE